MVTVRDYEMQTGMGIEMEMEMEIGMGMGMGMAELMCQSYLLLNC